MELRSFLWTPLPWPVTRTFSSRHAGDHSLSSVFLTRVWMWWPHSLHAIGSASYLPIFWTLCIIRSQRTPTRLLLSPIRCAVITQQMIQIIWWCLPCGPLPPPRWLGNMVLTWFFSFAGSLSYDENCSSLAFRYLCGIHILSLLAIFALNKMSMLLPLGVRRPQKTGKPSWVLEAQKWRKGHRGSSPLWPRTLRGDTWDGMETIRWRICTASWTRSGTTCWKRDPSQRRSTKKPPSATTTVQKRSWRPPLRERSWDWSLWHWNGGASPAHLDVVKVCFWTQASNDFWMLTDQVTRLIVI